MRWVILIAGVLVAGSVVAGAADGAAAAVRPEPFWTARVCITAVTISPSCMVGPGAFASSVDIAAIVAA